MVLFNHIYMNIGGVFLSKFKVCIDNLEFKNKPTPFETGTIANNIGKNLFRLSLKEIIAELEKGKSIMLSELSTIDIKSKLVSQQLFFLDIDNKNNYMSFEDAISNEFVKENACFAYKTFNDRADSNRFRICFVTEKPIKKEEMSLAIYENLISKFPSSDSACKNYNRIFYGTSNKVHIINLKNRLNETEFLLDSSNEDVREAYSLLKDNNIDDIMTIPNWVLIKLGRDDILKLKLKKYGISLADVNQFTEYFKRVDIGEFLELPLGSTFADIFHDEVNPSACIFKLPSGIQLYKCHSENHKFTGDLIRVVCQLRNCGIVSALNYLISITGSQEIVSEELKELRDSIDILKNLLLSEDLKDQYPELDKYVSGYRTDMVSILEILKTSTYWDSDRNDYRALFYYSTKTLSQKLGYANGNKYQKRVQRVLNLMTYMMFIDKLTTEETPKVLLNQLEKSRKENKFSRRVNVIEAKKFTDDSFEIIFDQCKKMFDDGFTVGGFNREYLLRNESEFVANRVFPQETKNLEDVNHAYENKIIKYMFDTIDEKGYVFEKDVRKELSRLTKSKAISDAKWKTIRTDLINTYGLLRVRLTKSIKEELMITDLPLTSSPFILKK